MTTLTNEQALKVVNAAREADRRDRELFAMEQNPGHGVHRAPLAEARRRAFEARTALADAIAEIEGR